MAVMDVSSDLARAACIAKRRASGSCDGQRDRDVLRFLEKSKLYSPPSRPMPLDFIPPRGSQDAGHFRNLPRPSGLERLRDGCAARVLGRQT